MIFSQKKENWAGSSREVLFWVYIGFIAINTLYWLSSIWKLDIVKMNSQNRISAFCKQSDMFSLMLLHWVFQNHNPLFQTVRDSDVCWHAWQTKLYLNPRAAGGLCMFYKHSLTLNIENILYYFQEFTAEPHT